MHRPLPQPRRPAILAAAVIALAAAPCPAIEMFTYFGDGSRIGLPSLEVPVEAYPGIPLRSDRLRARRRAMRMGPGSAVRIGPPGYARGITIRAMPGPGQPVPPLAAGRPLGADDAAEHDLGDEVDLEDEIPPAPEPEAVSPPSPQP